jgi:hypothetical protein
MKRIFAGRPIARKATVRQSALLNPKELTLAKYTALYLH